MRGAFLLLAGLFLGGCATDNTIPLATTTATDNPAGVIQPVSVTTPPPERPLPGDAPRTIGIETRADQEYRRLLNAFGGEYRNARIAALLTPMVARIGKTSEAPDLTYRLTLLNSSSVNAFALPDGNVFVSRGLLALANDTSEIAAVIAHEIAHVTSRHAFARADLQRRSDLVSRVAVEVFNDPVLGRALQTSGKVEVASFSRAQEIEADLIGVRNSARAGFDPYGATRFLTALGRSTAVREAALGSDSSRPDILSTHPTTPERIEAALFTARQLSAPDSSSGEKNRDAFLSAINGMLFGEDPRSGSIDGSTYRNPSLGFAFVAPAGLKLDQNAQSIVGVAADGNAALRFDAVKLDASDTLESYLARGLIEDVPTTNIETLNVNGLKAATATASGEEWTFRFGLFELGGNTYRMILAARALDPATDARFRAAIQSFRPLSPSDSAALKPQMIRLIRANAGDTAASLGTRMATGGEIAFRVLNNLGSTGQPEPGLSYKIVSRN
jgi:predicted Zn-dependent protease